MMSRSLLPAKQQSGVHTQFSAIFPAREFPAGGADAFHEIDGPMPWKLDNRRAGSKTKTDDNEGPKISVRKSPRRIWRSRLYPSSLHSAGRSLKTTEGRSSLDGDWYSYPTRRTTLTEERAVESNVYRIATRQPSLDGPLGLRYINSIGSSPSQSHADACKRSMEADIFFLCRIDAAVHGTEEKVCAIARADLEVLDLERQSRKAADIGHSDHS
jgi:hypothetical protein